MGFYLRALGGLIGAVLSVAWLVHVVLYMFVYPPISPFLNSFFITLDGAFPLFGTVAFALFCFYLIGGCFVTHDQSLYCSNNSFMVEVKICVQNAMQCCAMLHCLQKNLYCIGVGCAFIRFLLLHS